eukprot:COSAG01_NODE_2780_length_7087_cov_2.315639_3_plen_178_part_00
MLIVFAAVPATPGQAAQKTHTVGHQKLDHQKLDHQHLHLYLSSSCVRSTDGATSEGELCKDQRQFRYTQPACGTLGASSPISARSMRFWRGGVEIIPMRIVSVTSSTRLICSSSLPISWGWPPSAPHAGMGAPRAYGDSGSPISQFPHGSALVLLLAAAFRIRQLHGQICLQRRSWG